MAPMATARLAKPVQSKRRSGRTGDFGMKKISPRLARMPKGRLT